MGYPYSAFVPRVRARARGARLREAEHDEGLGTRTQPRVRAREEVGGVRDGGRVHERTLIGDESMNCRFA